ncbi:MAG: ABC transporter permease [Candidatus Sulfopaludibacter sp.]|nr:ABC transporter permease [Candidatus Sulfopaludibacter sp.]
MRRIFARLAGHFRRSHRERDMAGELASHFQMHIDDNLRAGMSPKEARRQAALKFGSLEATKEELRDMSTTLWLETTIRDVRYALRGLRRNPGFATAAILSLALGIGAGLSIFAVADGLLLRPLPFRDPGRIVMVWESHLRTEGSGPNVISPGNYFDWKKQNTSFESMAAFGDGARVLSDGNRVEELPDRFATADLLPMLGVKPYRGRFFTAAEDTPDGPEVLVIGYRLWQSWFAGDDRVIGRSVQLRSRPATIIGVLPPDFYFRDRHVDLWEPMGFDPARDYRATSGRYAMAVARLKPGVSLRRAQTEMTGIAGRLAAAYPSFDRYWTVNLEPLRDSMVREVKTSLLVLLGAVGLLLAVACANVANLLLARYTARKREIAVRIAIGAGRGRLVRQLLTESLILAAAGAALGLALSRFAVSGLLALAPRDMAATAVVSVDLRVAGFALALAILTGVLFGLAPSLVAARITVAHGLREASRSRIGGGRRTRSLLVAAEVALSLILLAGAGLLFRTMLGLQGTDPGLDPKGLLTFHLSVSGAGYQEDAHRTRFFETLLHEIRRLPGVRSASAVSYLPFTAQDAATGLEIAGRTKPRPGEQLNTTVRTVMPDYFRTMGIPIRSGRDFTPADNAPGAPFHFIVSETFARRYLAGENPLGKQISVAMDRKNPFGDIIGVAGDVKEGALNKPPEPTVYYIHAHLAYSGMVFVVRTSIDPLALAQPVRRVVRSLDPALPVADARTMDAVVVETFSRQRFSALLLGAFSAVSLLLAAVGIYGVLAYAVTERTREIGVRMALGAEPRRITVLVIAGAASVVLPGIAAGIAGALALSGLLRGLLFGVRPHDAVTLASAAVLLAAVALAAAYLPARRASRLLPLEALRLE